jgi:hypothetical protein
MAPPNENRPAGRQTGKAIKFKPTRERIYDASNHETSLWQDRHGAWHIGDKKISSRSALAKRGRNTVPIAVIRIREIERLVSYRLQTVGELPGMPELNEAALCLLRIARTKSRARIGDLLEAWADVWVPDLAHRASEVAASVADCHQHTADECGIALHLTQEERGILDIRTIGAIGTTRRSRENTRLEKKRLRERERRRKAGAKSRSDAIVRQIENLGISKATFYRKLKRETDSCPPVLSITTIGHETVSSLENGEVRRGKKAV